MNPHDRPAIELTDAQRDRALDLTPSYLAQRRTFNSTCRACGASMLSEPHPYRGCQFPTRVECSASIMVTAFSIAGCWVKGKDEAYPTDL